MNWDSFAAGGVLIGTPLFVLGILYGAAVVQFKLWLRERRQKRGADISVGFDAERKNNNQVRVNHGTADPPPSMFLDLSAEKWRVGNDIYRLVTHAGRAATERWSRSKMR